MKRIITLITVLIYTSILLAQASQEAIRITPKSPERSAFESYVKNPESNASGQADISIPIFNFESKGFSFPISLIYTGNGVKVNDIPTNAGMGWTLEAGAFISRNILGVPDEGINGSVGWFGVTKDDYDECDFVFLEPFYQGLYDTAPDIFSYHTYSNSGNFTFKKDKTLIKGVKDDCKIIPNGNFDGFTLIDARGNKYIFEPKEYSKQMQNSPTAPSSPTIGNFVSEGATAWLVKEIIPFDGDTIHFEYSTYEYSTGFIYKTNDLIRFTGLLATNHYSTRMSNNTFTTKLLNKISSKNLEITFVYEDFNSVDIMKKRLAKICRKDKITNESIEVALHHISRNNRLFLDYINFNSNYAQSYKYEITYQGGPIPEYGSYSQDIFGYINGNTQWHMIPIDPNDWRAGLLSYQPANREIDENRIKYGLIESIKYPTGGYVHFEFEPNKEIKNGELFFAPGVRIKNIDYFENINQYLSFSPVVQYTFQYKDLTCPNVYVQGKIGPFVNWSNEIYNGKAQDTEIISSSPISTQLLDNQLYYGVGYGKVEKLERNNTNQETLKTENHYLITQELFNSARSYLQKKIIYKNDNFLLVDSVVYEPEQFTSIEAKMLGDVTIHSSFFQDCNGNNYCSNLDLCPGTFVPRYPMLNPFVLTTTYYQKKANIRQSYFENNQILEERNEYEYNNYNQISKTKTTLNKNGQNYFLEKEYKYATDFTLQNSWIDIFKSANVISLPIDIREYINENNLKKLINGTVNIYNDKGNISEIYEAKLQEPLLNQFWSSSNLIPPHFESKVLINYYSNNSNIKETIENAITTTYLWSYNGTYPVAKIINGNYTTIESVLGGSAALKTFFNNPAPSDDYIRSFLSPLQSNSAASNMHAYIYTYKPLVGMTSMTDPRGVTTYYDYDSFGRLKETNLIEDGMKRILQKYDYHYANQ